VTTESHSSSDGSSSLESRGECSGLMTGDPLDIRMLAAHRDRVHTIVIQSALAAKESILKIEPVEFND
jgi:hypothetical protein